MELNDLEKALECCENSLKITPSDKGTWNNAGIVLVRMERFQEAIDCFDQSLKIDPNYSVTLELKESALDLLKE